jgi:hypothetical protein
MFWCRVSQPSRYTTSPNGYPVPQLTFSQPARRNLLVPVLVAFLIMGLAIALVIRVTPNKTAELSISRTTIFPTHTVFKSESTLIGHDQTENDLYILTNLRIDDRLSLPLFVKDFTAVLTTAEGETLTTSAAEQQDIPTIFASFPAIKPLASDPLLRDITIKPGQSAEGMILLHFPITKSVWDRRSNAELTVNFYHQGQQNINISRASEASPNTTSHPAQ